MGHLLWGLKGPQPLQTVLNCLRPHASYRAVWPQWQQRQCSAPPAPAVGPEAWLRQQVAPTGTAIESWGKCKDRLPAAAEMSRACSGNGTSDNRLLLPKDAKRPLKHTALSVIDPSKGCPQPVRSRQLTTIRKLSNSREGHPTTLSLSPNWRAHSLCR